MDQASIQTWEAWCAGSQQWADRARMQAIFRRRRKNAALVVAGVVTLVVLAW